MKATHAEDERLMRIWPMPGGGDRFADTLARMLGWLAEGPLGREIFRSRLTETYSLEGGTSVDGYLQVPVQLGFVRAEAGDFLLTEAGRAWREAPEPLALFDRLRATYHGFLETLVVVDWMGGASAEALRIWVAPLVGARWVKRHQAVVRRNWLLSLGLVTAAQGRSTVAITPAGRALLDRMKAEVEVVRDALWEMDREEVALSEWLPEEEEQEDRPADEGAPGPERVAPPVDPVRWRAPELQLRTDDLDRQVRSLGLRLPPRLVTQGIAALNSGKHLLLVGPPGTGKTELAHAIGAAATEAGFCRGLFSATASADWTTFDTIGGYALQQDRSLQFRPGCFVAAVDARQWLLVDELNRTDVDNAFGELMTVLSGRSTDTTWRLPDDRLVSIGPDARCTHVVPPTFRVLGTMNTWDKTSLFRLSFAVQRRFAILNVDPPEPEVYGALLHEAALDPALPGRPLDAALCGVVERWFSAVGILAHRPVGPAVALDLVRFLRERDEDGYRLGDGVAMFLLPQLEGLESRSARVLRELFVRDVTTVGSPQAAAELQLRYDDLFPTLGRSA